MRLILTIVLLFISSQAWATTWYVRADGETYGTTSTTCNGQTDAAYSGGGGPNCAVNSIYEIVQHNTDGAGGTSGTTRISGGDTVIVGAPDGVGGSTDQFEHGYDSARSVTPSGCSSSFPYGCYINSLPSGSDAAHPTKLVGRGYDTGCAGHKAQLWGANELTQILYQQSGSYIDIECLDITDHSSCVYAGPTDGCSTGSYPQGDWVRRGIFADSVTNLSLINLDIHGLADRNIMMSRNAGTTTINNVKSISAGSAGIDMDNPGAGDDTWTGTINGNFLTIDWSGCHEAYPLNATIDDVSNESGCSSQGQGIYSDGWGFGSGSIGTINCTDCKFSWNTQDGFDDLDTTSSGAINFNRVHAEGNSGNQLKMNTMTGHVENSVIIGNCGFFAGQSFTYTGSGGFDNVCRGTGQAIVLAQNVGGQKYYIYNNTITGNGDTIILTSPSGGGSCDPDTLWDFKNNVILGGTDITSGGIESAGFYFNDGTGTCVGKSITEDYDQVYGTKEGTVDGAHSRYGDPLLSGQSTLKMTVSPYYQGQNALSLVPLSSTSPSRFVITGANSADETISCTGDCSLDYNGASRGITNWDGGAIEFSAQPTACTTCKYQGKITFTGKLSL